jgi:hypothetical protein
MSDGGPAAQELRITGMPTAEELAALLVLLEGQPAPPPGAAYERWRKTRTAALKRTQKCGMT